MCSVRKYATGLHVIPCLAQSGCRLYRGNSDNGASQYSRLTAAPAATPLEQADCSKVNMHHSCNADCACKCVNRSNFLTGYRPHSASAVSAAPQTFHVKPSQLTVGVILLVVACKCLHCLQACIGEAQRVHSPRPCLAEREVSHVKLSQLTAPCSGLDIARQGFSCLQEGPDSFTHSCSSYGCPGVAG